MSSKFIESSDSAPTRESLSSLRMIQQPSVPITVSLYATDISLACAAIKIALTFKRVPFVEIPPPDGVGSAEYKKIIPTGQVPAMLHADFAVMDSMVIMEYLEENFSDLSPPLLVWKNSQKNSLTRYAYRIHDLYLEPAIRGMYPHICAAKRDMAVVDSKLAIIHEQLADLERVCDSHGPFYCGDQMTYADCVLPGTMLMLDMLVAEFYGQGIEYYKKYPKLNNVRETHFNHFAITSVLMNMKDAAYEWILRVKASPPEHISSSPRSQSGHLPKIK